MLEFLRELNKHEKHDINAYTTLQSVVKRPMIVVRLNAGKFKADAKPKTQLPSLADRLNALYHFLQAAVVPSKTPLIIKHMFYDGFPLNSGSE